ncbi:hypothetical protein OG754_38735 [Streptomyces decoyicus]|uniref:hypothetical protein n=1 Tax=Streptomyces decoyicus TaxID=249567 RepID=UPI002E370EBB|nr:hypothetical protein [Streptomyces decoyicus]
MLTAAICHTAPIPRTYLGDTLAVLGRHEAPEQLAAPALDLGYLPLALSQAAAYLIDADLPIESPFATVRADEARQGARSRVAALARDFQPVESAQARWRAVNTPHLVGLVRAEACCERGRLVERSEMIAA